MVALAERYEQQAVAIEGGSGDAFVGSKDTSPLLVTAQIHQIRCGIAKLDQRRGLLGVG